MGIPPGIKTPRRTGLSRRLADGLQPTLQVLWDLGKTRVKTKAVVKEEEDGSRAEVLEASSQRCQGPALLLLTVPRESAQRCLPKPQGSVFSRLALSHRDIRRCV